MTAVPEPDAAEPDAPDRAAPDFAPAIAAVKRFFFAIAIGDGEAIWDELGEQARAFVLNVAVQQGMDFELGSRLRLGTAADVEWTAYLANLAGGLQRDLDGIDLSDLVYSGEALEGGEVRVRYAVPLGLELSGRPRGTVAPTIPAGSVICVREEDGPEGRWAVRRLVPRPGP